MTEVYTSASGAITFSGSPNLRVAGKPIEFHAIPDSYAFRAVADAYGFTVVPQSFTFRGAQ
jgi:hypothetical protein